MEYAPVIDIKRFAVHDGDGIRTTVFLKGCSLHCLWCHNPEGINPLPQLAYYQNKCINCGECVMICKSGAQKIVEGRHVFDRAACKACGECENVCLGKAIKFYGRKMSTEELIPVLLEDQMFYEHSGGGITISGGEALLHPEFCAELLREMKQRGINTAVDTCGNVPRNNLACVVPYTDTFLYDIKAIDEDVHKNCTGHSNKQILSNLEYLDFLRCKVEVRIPYVPGYNDNQMQKIAEYLRTFKNIVRVRVLPYHNYAGSKYTALGMKNTLPPDLPGDEEIMKTQKLFD